MVSLQDRIAAIEERNKKVELDKAWETSLVRRASIALLTYGVIAFFLCFTKNSRPLLNAVVPVVGYVLSTLVMSRIRSVWQKNR